MSKCTLGVFGLAAALIGTGCAERTTTTSVPPGPVVTSSASDTVLPSGTQMVIRTNETISAEAATANQTFSAEVVKPVMNQNGQVLVPAGSPATLQVVRIDRDTVGDDDLELALNSITINGRRHNVSTPAVSEQGREGIGVNRRTGKYVGGGALLGTVIGAIAGGGTGAAVGAAVGAAGGAAAQVMTRGDKISVPAETVVTFQLDQPLTLVGHR